MPEKGSRWSREEMIVVLDLYFKLPFGRLNRTTPEVKELATLMGRTNNSVAYRLVNYAACDPYILATGRHGMASGSKQCKPYWDEFINDKERLVYEAQKIRASLLHKPIEQTLSLMPSDFIGHDRETVIRARVNQSVFRTMILSNYEYRCAVTGIDIPELLIASHIIPWSEDHANRLNPENGICLSPLYDKLFDKGLISISEDYKMLLSYELKQMSSKKYYADHFALIDNKQISLPVEHKPNIAFLNYHRVHIFAAHN